MKDLPLVSVVLPAYNAELYIREAVLSVLAQTESSLEVILINDGSTDGTAEICRELKSNDRRIVYVDQANQGIVRSLNVGLELSRAPFIARMDADDIANPERFATQLSVFRNHPDVVVCGSDVELFGVRTGYMRLPRHDRGCRAMLLFMPCFAHPAVMFRRKLIDVGLRYSVEHEYVEDYEFWTRASKFGRLANVASPLLRYRTHPDQITSTKRERQKELQAEIASAAIRAIGVSVSASRVKTILWPASAMRSRIAALISTASLSLRLARKGHFEALTTLRLLRNITRGWAA